MAGALKRNRVLMITDAKTMSIIEDAPEKSSIPGIADSEKNEKSQKKMQDLHRSSTTEYWKNRSTQPGNITNSLMYD